METMIDIKNLTKSFGKVQAVKNLSLSVPAGEIFGLVGSDGAGKTTTLRMLVGALQADSGNISISGFAIPEQVEEARLRIGYLSQRFSMYEDLTVLENIRFFAEVRGLDRNTWLPRCLEILEFVGLAGFKDRRAGQLSGGMKQKLGLASALVSNPSILLLDEPTTGVDPLTRQDFWQLLVRLVNEQNNGGIGVAVILTTPYMDEASRCSRIGFMRTGELIASGSPTELRQRLQDSLLEVKGGPVRVLSSLITGNPDVDDVRIFGDRLHVRVKPGSMNKVQTGLQTRFSQSGYNAVSVYPVAASLEDVFLALSEQFQESPVSKLDLPEAQARALQALLDLVPPREFGWMLTGSANLRLQGVDVPVNDIDLYCPKESIHAMEKAMKEYIQTPVHLWESDSLRSLDGKLVIHGIQVELISQMQGLNEQGQWVDRRVCEQDCWVNWRGKQIPVISLEDELNAYEMMGRKGKADAIRGFFRSKPEVENG